MTAVLTRCRRSWPLTATRPIPRLICPRRLADNTGYHAFVVPTFETGRLAGLGLRPGRRAERHCSRRGPTTRAGRGPQLPGPYYRWYFRTGSFGRLRIPGAAAQAATGRQTRRRPRHGRAGPGLEPARHHRTGAERHPAPRRRAAGARRRPRPGRLAERQVYENWDQPYPDAFQTALAAFIDLADNYAAQTAAAANAASGLGPDATMTPTR